MSTYRDSAEAEPELPEYHAELEQMAPVYDAALRLWWRYLTIHRHEAAPKGPDEEALAAFARAVNAEIGRRVEAGEPVPEHHHNRPIPE